MTVTWSSALGRLGTAAVVLLTVVALLSLVYVAALKTASADLNAQVEIALNGDGDRSRTAVGAWVSAALASDVPTTDISARKQRATEMDQHGDRLLEITATIALIGMLLALTT